MFKSTTLPKKKLDFSELPDFQDFQGFQGCQGVQSPESARIPGMPGFQGFQGCQGFHGKNGKFPQNRSRSIQNARQAHQNHQNQIPDRFQAVKYLKRGGKKLKIQIFIREGCIKDNLTGPSAGRRAVVGTWKD